LIDIPFTAEAKVTLQRRDQVVLIGINRP